MSAGVQKGISGRVQTGTDLEGVFSEDFWPVIEGWFWWMRDRPEVPEGMVDHRRQSHLGGFAGGS